MAIYAVTNQKGGVGKTTTATSLAAAFAAMRSRVLLIDLDSQCNATVAAGVALTAGQPTLSEVMQEKVGAEEAVICTEHGFDMIPSSHRLTATELQLVHHANKEYVLQERIEPLARTYHYVLIDCPPALNIMTINALVTANAAIIPVQCEYLALEGLAKLLKTS